MVGGLVVHHEREVVLVPSVVAERDPRLRVLAGRSLGRGVALEIAAAEDPAVLARPAPPGRLAVGPLPLPFERPGPREGTELPELHARAALVGGPRGPAAGAERENQEPSREGEPPSRVECRCQGAVPGESTPGCAEAARRVATTCRGHYHSLPEGRGA